MKTFGGAKRYIFIDQNNIDRAKDWLGQQQMDNGCFASVGRLYHIEMMVRTEESCSVPISTAEKHLKPAGLIRFSCSPQLDFIWLGFLIS